MDPALLPVLSPETEAKLTPRGRLAVTVALAAHQGATDAELAAHFDLPLHRIPQLRSYAKRRVFARLVACWERRCVVCDELLPVDARADAYYCPASSTCRRKAKRVGVSVRPCYRGRWTNSMRRPPAEAVRATFQARTQAPAPASTTPIE
jgi:hypothetical protein